MRRWTAHPLGQRARRCVVAAILVIPGAARPHSSSRLGLGDRASRWLLCGAHCLVLHLPVPLRMSAGSAGRVPSARLRVAAGDTGLGVAIAGSRVRTWCAWWGKAGDVGADLGTRDGPRW